MSPLDAYMKALQQRIDAECLAADPGRNPDETPIEAARVEGYIAGLEAAMHAAQTQRTMEGTH